MAGLSEDIVNRALDQAGAGKIIGNLADGSREAEIARRHYGPVLRQLLRTANWAFARKMAPLNLLADATGSTTGVGTTVPQGWTYEYAYPTDCVRLRFIPQSATPLGNLGPSGNTSLPDVPLTGVASSTPPLITPVIPTRFLVTTDYNYPVDPSVIQVPPLGNTPWWQMQGISPANRTVILSNVKQAQGVYTCLQIYPSLWDDGFAQAFAACLGAEFAVPLATDKNFGLKMQAQCIAVAKDKIGSARAQDGQEGWTTVDHMPDWLRARNQGGGWGPGWSWGGGYGGAGGAGGAGVLGYGWDSYGFPNGSAF